MNYPNQCYLELTQRCNLKCLHCFAQSSWGCTEEMTLADVKDIYQQIEELGLIWINLSGGEPLLHPNFFDIIEFAALKPYYTSLLTNGCLWDDTSTERMAHADPERRIDIQISLDGPSHEVIRRQRPMTQAEYEQMMWSIQRFKSLGFTVHCLHVVSAATASHSLETIRQALFDLQVDGIQVVPLFPTGRAAHFRSKLDGFWQAWAQLVVDLTLIKKHNSWGAKTDLIKVGFFTLFELVMPLDQAGMHDDILDIWGLDTFSKETFQRQTRRDFYCEAGRSELAISSSLELFPCVASLRTTFRGGDLKEQSLLQLWRESDTLNWFRTELAHVIEREPCCDCHYKDICGGGCRLAALEMTGDRLHPDPRCPLVSAYLIEEASCV